jgi:dihydrodiol dehydrogenase / D-xylose 1-dehydrogenase (NADP)
VTGNPIRWGILGTGYIARKFAEALTFVPEARLVAVGSRSAQTAEDFAREYQRPRVHASYQALIEDPEVDVVYIATVNNLHRENCLAALNAGKPVLCEKPFMVNSAEAVEVISLAREKKLFLMEALWTRYIPAFQKARQVWEAGLIGELKVVESDFGFICDRNPPGPLYDPALAGGSMLDVGAYPISLAHIAFGEPDSVAALAHIDETGVDVQTGMLFGYRGGQIGVGYSSFDVESPKEATIIGTKGFIRIHTPFFCPSSFSVHINGQDPQLYTIPYEGNGWNYEAVEVMRCLREGQMESELAPHAETLALMRTMDRIRREIRLKYPFEG